MITACFAIMGRPERADRIFLLARELVSMRARQVSITHDPLPDEPPSAAGTWRCARSAWDNALTEAREHESGFIVLLQDDVLLCKDFVARAEAALAERPDALVTFFSRRAAVLRADTRGERWASIPASQFLMAQAIGLRLDHVESMLAACTVLAQDNPTLGDDALYKRWLKATPSVQVWATVPSLVDHDPQCKSLIPGRANNRTAPLFAGGQIGEG